MESIINVESLLEMLADGQGQDLTNEAHVAVSMPQTDKAFLAPHLKMVHGSAPFPIVILSAPGAVGKTALAKYLSARKSCYLWDLSKLKLGDNSLVGTIAQCFGADRLSGILTALKEGKMCFVIDAFDEAEILSGWDKVEGLLDEICRCASSSSLRASFVLLARSETASLLGFYIDEEGRYKQPYLMLEIDYFNYEQARRFIYLQVEKIARDTDDVALSKRLVQYQTPFLEAVDSIFDSIYRAFSLKPENAWRSRALCSFLGYAPVLQAIAAYLATFSNYQDVQRRIGEGMLSVESAKVASSIMHDLLVREQEKVALALKGRKTTESSQWEDWDNIYSPEEQLRRVMAYVVKGPEALSLGLASKGIPAWLVEQYSQCLSSFLPQHPFLRGHAFTGPAFRDYVLALFLQQDENSKLKARAFMETPQYVATPLLIQFYRADGNELVSGNDLDFLYESFMSRDTFLDLSSAMIVVAPGSQSILHRVELYDIPTENEEYVEPIALYVRKEDPLSISFRRRLRNAFSRD